MLLTKMGDQYFSFEVHHGGQFVWNPQVAYVGGKVDYVGEFDPARLSLFEIRDVYYKMLGGTGAIDLYYRWPGYTLDTGLSLINCDADVLKMLEMYKGLTVIVIYVDKLMDPLLVMSSNGEILLSSPVMPRGLVIDLSDNDDSTGVKDFGAETITETEVEDIGDENLTEVGDIGDENVTGVEEWARKECDLSDADSEDSDYIASEEDNDEISDDDEVSDDASWMYEDLEGPEDDIFEVNSHRRVDEQPQPQPTNTDVNTDEKWYSNPEDEENLSLKGSSDEEGDGHPEFKVKIHMANPILVEGMKFTGARQFREFLKEWNVVNRYDIEYKKNESTRITVVCRYGCTWRIHASPIMRTTTFQIKSITGEHECGRQYDNRQANSSYIGKKLLDEIKDNPTINITSFKNKIRRKIMVDASRIYSGKQPPHAGSRTRAGRGATGRETNGRGMTTSTGRGMTTSTGRGMTTSIGRGTTRRGVTTVGTGRGRGAGSSHPSIGSSSQPVGRSTGRGVTGRGRGVGSTQPPTGSSSQPIRRGTGRGVTGIGAERGGKASSSGPVGGPTLATVLQNIRAKKQARVTWMKWLRALLCCYFIRSYLCGCYELMLAAAMQSF
ncbi:hypothetical protein RHSIM_Rhsim05G0109600 [Rhododendron simsii]|uniref:Transposase MuDR plant domain-containing protein n=1 Tax=Rhododendron simsii TaxID=118357 RepID=A0A834H9C2_RHOSS|nr:hypothetical protein RHSIM_Rhsim05G0109600 [Rhododendron simsii]